ncbi:MAG TPA: glycosyltransferase [Fimbriiglobus sp.]|jgi:cellulose synthase/poly-beta-1,6-N-acetylglucosamine synthase-like glycosyltransferase
MLVAAICVLFLVPATVVAGAYALYTLAGLRIGFHSRRAEVKRRAERPAGGSSQFSYAVLIPAYNEALGIASAIRSVRRANAGISVFVVADNCTDATAAVARDNGAVVLERFDLARRGKGHALAFGLPSVLDMQVNVVVILDADCTLSEGTFAAFDRAFATGAEALQATLRSANPDAGPAGLAAAVGCEIDAATAAGQDCLGRSVPLRGTGMAFTSNLLRRIPWEGFGPAEDAEYDRTLAAAGVRVRFVPDAVVSSDAPPDTAILLRQRRRWRAALSPITVRTLATSKPFVLLHLAATVLASEGTGLPALLIWAAVPVVLTGFIYLRAVCEVGLTRSRIWNLLKIPVLVFRLAGVTAAGAVAAPVGWDRTPRPGEPCRAAA